jgi:hypothetical protein
MDHRHSNVIHKRLHSDGVLPATPFTARTTLVLKLDVWGVGHVTINGTESGVFEDSKSSRLTVSDDRDVAIV